MFHPLFRKIGFVILLLGLSCSSASAIELRFKDSAYTGLLDVTLSYANMWRVSSQTEGRAGMTDPNFDDGNRNFDTGLVSNVGKLVYDFRLQTDRGDNTFGIFSRGYAFWDTELKNATNDNEKASPTNNSGALYGGSLRRTNTFTDKTEDRSGADVEILDFFLFGEFARSSNHPFSIRVGNQVVSWGESAFIQSGISSVINPSDVSKAKIPGTEVKEILLPVYQVYGSVDATSALSFSAYYQFNWDNTIAPPHGTFLSTNDFIADDGAENLLIPVLPPPAAPFVNTPYLGLDRATNIDPDDSGQWGVAANWFCEMLNDTEFGFYYVNYHRKIPDLVVMSDGLGTVDHIWSGPPGPLQAAAAYFDSSRYAHKYFEDVELIGFSWNTMLPEIDTAFSGEIAYHHDVPIQTISSPAGLQALAPGGVPAPGTVVNLSTREDMVVTQMMFNKDLNLPSIADDIGFIVEFGYVKALGLHDGEIWRGPRPADDDAWGYKAKLTLTYFDAFYHIWDALTSTDLQVLLSFDHDVDGVSAIPVGSFTDHEKSVGIGFEVSWQNVITANITYNNFFGAGNKSAISDRDNISFIFKYRF